MEDKLRHGFRLFVPFFLKVCLYALMAFLILGSLYVGLDPNDCRILPHVSVGGIDVGNMDPEKAYKVLDAASDAILENTVLSVELPEETIHLSPADTKARLQTWRAVLSAFLVGRIGNQSPSISLSPYLDLEESYIRQALAEYASQYDTTVTASRYTLSGDVPDLEIENQSETNQPQILELTMGLPTARLDQEHAFRQIMAVYDSAFEEGRYFVKNAFHVDVLKQPEKPDLQAIYDELYVAPVDDSLDMKKHTVIPGAFGYHFDLEAAEQLVSKAKFGETISLPMDFLEPEIYGEEVYFRDVLGYCETPHTKDENRNNNLRRACESMNGLILQPGEVFSYNDTLGPRTKDNGYLPAGAYSGWVLVQSYGGGICQGSSTIYCAALYADLEIVLRKNHGYTVSYIDPGLDATVNWGGPDFQFRNSTHFPIKIAAEVSDGHVKVSILGTEERDYYIKMESESGWSGGYIYARSYKCKYDRETDERISREPEARSTYMG